MVHDDIHRLSDGELIEDVVGRTSVSGPIAVTGGVADMGVSEFS